MKTILVDAVEGLFFKDGTMFDDMYRLLETYPNRKLVLTGANDQQFKEFKLDQSPYKVFTLKHDPEKSNPEYFKIMLQAYELDAKEVVFFEHNEAATQSARSVGIQTYFYDHTRRDLAALKSFLDTSI